MKDSGSRVRPPVGLGKHCRWTPLRPDTKLVLLLHLGIPALGMVALMVLTALARGC
jgi:hypothetical protein